MELAPAWQCCSFQILLSTRFFLNEKSSIEIHIHVKLYFPMVLGDLARWTAFEIEGESCRYLPFIKIRPRLVVTRYHYIGRKLARGHLFNWKFIEIYPEEQTSQSEVRQDRALNWYYLFSRKCLLLLWTLPPKVDNTEAISGNPKQNPNRATLFSSTEW